MKFMALMIFLMPQAFALECTLRSHEALGRLVLDDVQKLKCSSQKRVHLTFDDGPHSEYTPLLLRELNLRKVKSTFFVSTTNIAPGKNDQRKMVASIMDQGHTVGSHGHRHEAYDLRLNSRGLQESKELTPQERAEEIRLSTKYLNEATENRFRRQPYLLFRFPYGRGAAPSDLELDEMEKRGEMKFSARDRATRLKEYRALSEPLHAIGAQGYGHLLWNHDSGDSTSDAPSDTLASKASFAAKNLRHMCSSSRNDIIALFHDIKQFNPEVVSAIIDVGQCLGLRFVDAPTILSSKSLQDAGTFISKKTILSTPVQQVDAIAELIKNLGPNCKPENPGPGSCFSESMNRYFADCEAGEVSICIQGNWYKKTEEKLRDCRARGL